MLPAVHRLRRADEFRRALRSGDRAGSRLLVLYRSTPDPADEHAPARIGFVVSKQVGAAVVRNRVKRRLRHQSQARLARLSTGSLYVVRANPAASSATSDELGAALDACLDKVEQ